MFIQLQNDASWIEFMISSKSPNWKDIAVTGVVNGTCLVKHSLDILLLMEGEVGEGESKKQG